MGMIVLEDIEVMARIGLLEEELYAPQDLTVSVEIEHSFDRISRRMTWPMGSITGKSLNLSVNFAELMMGKPSSVWLTFFANRSKKNFLPSGYIWFSTSPAMSTSLAFPPFV